MGCENELFIFLVFFSGCKERKYGECTVSVFFKICIFARLLQLTFFVQIELTIVICICGTGSSECELVLVAPFKLLLVGSTRLLTIHRILRRAEITDPW